MRKLKFYISICFLLLSFSMFSQHQDLHFDINWHEKQAFFAPKVEISEQSNKYLLYFEGASYDYSKNYLPVFTKLFPLLSGNKKAELINKKFVSLTHKDIAEVYDTEKISEKIELKNEILYAQKRKFLKFSFVPLRKNPANGKYEKLVSFDVKLIDAKNERRAKSAKKLYRNQSVLSSGKWVKIKIAKSGVYKLTFAELEKLGIKDAANVRIFGSGGSMLPFYNSQEKIDDLVENKIFIKDNVVYFYAQGVAKWRYDKEQNIFRQNLNLYSNYAYYFLSSDYNSGKNNKIQIAPSPSETANKIVNTFDALAYHEIDSVNLIGSGRLWVGEHLDFSTDFHVNFDMPNLVVGSNVKIISSLIARSPIATSFSISLEGADFSTTVPAVNYGYTSKFASQRVAKFTTKATSSDKIAVDILFNKSTASSEAWIDYLTVNARRKLIYTNKQMNFRDVKSVGKGNISEFNIGNANGNLLVWDVSVPTKVKQIDADISGSLLTFQQKTDSLKEFVSFELSQAYSPITKGEDLGLVANQNLHGIERADLVIVSPDEFLSFAHELKQIHNESDKLKVAVVSTQQIYNEFSSGAPDVSAIRNFMKMLYDRANNQQESPKYLCLFGDGSYDNRHVFAGNTNFIPTYQSASSLSPTQSFVTDDYFGLLDDDEGEHIGLLDIGIGRFPVKNKAEAAAAIQKIRNYKSIKSLGEWKNRVCFIADDEDANLHISQSNILSNILEKKYSYLNIQKIFLDAYPQKSSSTGQRYPDVVLGIDNQMNNGVLLMNYTGHGGKMGLADEQIITIDQIRKWHNIYKLPVFMTATCEFSRFDYYKATTAGEHVFLNPDGGAIAMFTTTRVVYASPNFDLNTKFYDYFFENDPISNQKYRLGDIMRLTKNTVGSDMNKRNFTLFGDPALQISSPQYFVKTKSINEHSTEQIDTISAFDKVRIKGEIQNKSNQLINNYNGVIYATVFDKKQSVKTLNNDGDGVFEFSTQNSQIFRGKASVKNGVFQLNFVVPKDIKYNIDKGKISYYADNKHVFEDAKGSFTNILIGGVSKNINDNDNTGPEIEIFLNDENFVDGGITNSLPTLIVALKDADGINTTGTGIGHNIVATIDNDKNKKFILNDFYESDIDNFTSGKINYKLPKMELGEHILRVKAWDVFNNSSIDSIRFNVVENEEFTISRVLNYPNPFSTNTSFFFEHNRPNDVLEVFIHVFTVAGRIVKTIHTEIISNSYRSTGIAWDGKDDFGNKIGRGVYFYKLSVKTNAGEQASKIEKLLILN